MRAVWKRPGPKPMPRSRIKGFRRRTRRFLGLDAKKGKDEERWSLRGNVLCNIDRLTSRTRSRIQDRQQIEEEEEGSLYLAFLGLQAVDFNDDSRMRPLRD